MQETERNRSNEPSVPAVLFDPGVRVDEAGNGVLATLVLESGAAGRLRAGLPLLQLVLEVGQALRAVRRAGSDKKPVSTLARSADERIRTHPGPLLRHQSFESRFHPTRMSPKTSSAIARTRLSASP